MIADVGDVTDGMTHAAIVTFAAPGLIARRQSSTVQLTREH